MTFSNINVGVVANDGTGDPLRNAMIIVNNNFQLIKDNYLLIGATFSISDIQGLQTILSDIQTTLNSLEIEVDSIPGIQSDIVSINNTIVNINNTLSNHNFSIIELQNDLLNLYNTIGDYIPLTGTTDLKPITGPLTFAESDGDDVVIFRQVEGDYLNNISILPVDGNIELRTTNTVTSEYSGFLIDAENGILFQSPTASKGLVGSSLFDKDNDDNAYVQFGDLPSPIELTTTGITGSATFSNNILNIPRYDTYAQNLFTTLSGTVSAIGASVSSNTIAINNINTLITIASLTQSGIINTGTQSISGNKTIRGTDLSNNALSILNSSNEQIAYFGNDKFMRVTDGFILNLNRTTTNVSDSPRIRFTGANVTTQEIYAEQGNIIMTGGLLLGTSSVDNSAKIKIDSTTQGALAFPRMTEAQRLAIVSPAIGLQVYQTDGDSGNWVFTSLGWLTSSSKSNFKRVDANYTLLQSDSGKYILIAGNTRTVTVPTGLTDEFHITLDFEGTGGLIVDSTTTMYGDNTGFNNGTVNNYNVPQNGSFYFIRNTVDGRIRTKGDFI